jgi:hypothetical protein
MGSIPIRAAESKSLRDVGATVARVPWEHETVGSTPTVPTSGPVL